MFYAAVSDCTRYVYRNNNIFINKRNNSIQRTGENSIYYLNLQNENETSGGCRRIIQRYMCTSCSVIVNLSDVLAFCHQVCPASLKSTEDTYRRLRPNVLYVRFL